MADNYGEEIKRFTTIPVEALGSSSRVLLGKHLNPPANTVSEKAVLQDKEGLAELMGYSYQDIQNYNLQSDFTKALLEDWSMKQGSTIALLWNYIEELERYDILSDQRLKDRIAADVKRWKHSRELDEAQFGPALQDPEVSSHDQPCSTDDHHIDEFKNITVGEVKTGRPEYFDAFVCYTTEDFPFVRQMMQMLEQRHGLKLCISNRDLMPGTSRYTVVAKLIEERCKKMIIILSPEYLRSTECDFQTKFAHSLSPGSRSKKLIPVLKHPCNPPNILRHITPVDYTKCDLVEWFWERLARSLEENSNTSANEDDVSALSVGPPQVPMAEGTLPVRQPRNYTAPITSDRTSPSSNTSFTMPTHASSSLTDDVESSMETSGEITSSSISSSTSACSSLPSSVSMDYTDDTAAAPNITMPAPTPTKKKKDKKKGIFSFRKN